MELTGSTEGGAWACSGGGDSGDMGKVGLGFGGGHTLDSLPQATAKARPMRVTHSEEGLGVTRLWKKVHISR